MLVRVDALLQVNQIHGRWQNPSIVPFPSVRHARNENAKDRYTRPVAAVAGTKLRSRSATSSAATCIQGYTQTIYTLTAARSHTCTQHLAKVSLVLRLGSRGEANKSGQTASYYSDVQLSAPRLFTFWVFIFYVCLSVHVVWVYVFQKARQSRSNVISKAGSLGYSSRFRSTHLASL